MPYIEDIKFLKILVPTSGPIPAEENARYILKMARSLRAEVVVVHVRDKGESREGDLALDIFDKVSKELGVKVRLKPAIGEVSKTLIEIAKLEEVNLIVLGATEGRNVARWIIDKIKEETDIPVVIIPWRYEKYLHKETISA
jgi:nucleotide-binding universal stress UspA family protein